MSGEELEERWYQIMHSQPSKRTEKTVFQLTFTKHSFKDALEQLKMLSPSHIKKGIHCCIKYSKQYWTKSSDTYLFPSAAITFFLYSPSPSGYELIPECTPENALDCYKSLINSPGPDDFTKYCGTNPAIFPLWDCVGRPYVSRMAHLYKDTLESTLHCHHHRGSSCGGLDQIAASSGATSGAKESSLLGLKRSSADLSRNHDGSELCAST